MLPGEINERFLAFFRARSYVIAGSAPILASDPTVLFVNASVTPFKPVMLANRALPRTAVVQRCFRAQDVPTYLFAFDMLGIVADARSSAGIEEDLFRFLDSLGMTRERLLAVVDARDADLQRTASAELPRERVFTQTGNSKKYCTRWEFGHGERLVGRGMTIVGELPGSKPCGDFCGWECVRCRRFVPLGNIILIRSADADQEYLDVGFGAEAVVSFFHSGDILQSPPVSDCSEALRELSELHGQQRQVVRLLLGIRELTAAGIRPGARKHAYVMRKLMRQVLAILCRVEEGGEESVRKSLRQVIGRMARAAPSAELWTSTEAFLLAESRLYAQAIVQGAARARGYLAHAGHRSDEACRERLRESYGLPDRVIDRILADRLRDGTAEGDYSEKTKH